MNTQVGIPLDLIVFDMAGTTVEVADLVPLAFRQAFEPLGVLLSDDAIRAIRGRSKREAISQLLQGGMGQVVAPEQVERVYARFQQTLVKQCQQGKVSAMPGAVDVFEWLRERDIRAVLTTGFDRPVVDALMDRLGWQEVVNAVVCNADVPRGRPAPYLIFRAMEATGSLAVDRIAVVGDTTADLESAANAGARWRIGVLSGAHTEAQLRACSPTHIIPGVRDLPAILRQA